MEPVLGVVKGRINDRLNYIQVKQHIFRRLVKLHVEADYEFVFIVRVRYTTDLKGKGKSESGGNDEWTSNETATGKQSTNSYEKWTINLLHCLHKQKKPEGQFHLP